MKLKYILKEKFKESKTVVFIAAIVILVLLISGSYAIFTATSESKGSLNIVTGDLKPHMESNELDSDHEIVLLPNEVKTISIKLKNINPIAAKYNLYYSYSKNDANVDIGYLSTGDAAPTTDGYTIEKSGSSTDSKTIKIRMLNNEKENITVTFGSGVGLSNDTLTFPSGKKALTEIKTNIIQAYNYNDDNSATNYCVNGDEATCEKATCLEKDENDQPLGTCPAGTIIRYAVNDTTNKYFYVLHDDGPIVTMQQRENTVKNIAWISKDDFLEAHGTEDEYDGNSGNNNSKGPLTILKKVEEATSTWTNVRDQVYQMSITNFNNTNAFTGCSAYGTCDTPTYTTPEKTVKARLITLQESNAINCTNTAGSCPKWMYNYLQDSTSHGGTVNDNNSTDQPDNSGYWTMSSYSSNTSAWVVSYDGKVLYQPTNNLAYGARAVVVINK